MQTPNELMDEFEMAVAESRDPGPIVHEIIGDVVHSFELALIATSLPKEERDEVLTTLRDYITNHYGDL